MLGLLWEANEKKKLWVYFYRSVHVENVLGMSPCSDSLWEGVEVKNHHCWGGSVCLRGLQLWLGAKCSLGKQKNPVYHQLVRLRLWQLLPEPLILAS